MTNPNTPEPDNSGRSRARRNVIGASPHRDEYERLMKAGWSSLAIERYAAFRYGEDVPASTVRSYRGRKKIAAEKVRNPLEGVDMPDSAADVLGVRARLIALQQERIAIDWGHEKSMSKLFGSTRGEIAALSALLDAHKADLQDLGLMPKAGQSIEIDDRREKPSAASAPVAQTLGDLLGGMDAETEAGMARVLHMAAKNGQQAANGAASNGKSSGGATG